MMEARMGGTFAPARDFELGSIKHRLFREGDVLVTGRRSVGPSRRVRIDSACGRTRP